jgi:23S rRNA pseudouridine2605 synthase
LVVLKPPKHFGLAQAINKAGFASRSQATKLVAQGRVSWKGRIVRDPEWLVFEGDEILVDGKHLEAVPNVYLVCNKPRGLVTSADDPKGRPTVYSCLEGLSLTHVGPVGRLDLDSEGLLLFTNDAKWASDLLDPDRHVSKTYHVRIDGFLREDQIGSMIGGVIDKGERLKAISVTTLRREGEGSWIEIVLQEGKNRQIRRMIAAMGLDVQRLIRVRIGDVVVADLAKGAVRPLTETEVEGLRQNRSAATRKNRR